MTTRYRKKLIEVDAIQWTGPENCAEVFAFIGCDHPDWEDETDHSQIFLDHPEPAHHGDWIVRDAEGDFHAVSADVFAATYEPVEAE